MNVRRLWPIALVLAAALVLAGCGGAPTPVTCGVTSTGDPNLAKFQEGYNSVVLINKSTSQPGQVGSDGSAQFAANDPLVIRLDAKTGGSTVRFCIQKTDSNGQISYDQSVATKSGANDYDIGSFQAGTYIARLIERNVLVANLPFTIK